MSACAEERVQRPVPKQGWGNRRRRPNRVCSQHRYFGSLIVGQVCRICRKSSWIFSSLTSPSPSFVHSAGIEPWPRGLSRFLAAPVVRFRPLSRNPCSPGIVPCLQDLFPVPSRGGLPKSPTITASYRAESADAGHFWRNCLYFPCLVGKTAETGSHKTVRTTSNLRYFGVP